MTKEPLGLASLNAILAGRSAAPRRFYKADQNEIAYVAEPVEFQVDESRMAVGPVVISTPAVDRVGDVLIPTGCVIDDYARNPVILWEHGYSGEEGGSMPIASAADPDGNLHVEITDEAVKSWAFFHGKTLLSDQVFHLIAAGIVKAASVRPKPMVSSLITHEGDEIGILMEQWSMSEWSFVTIGCNQEALTKTVRDGKLLGKKLAVPLMKSFNRFVPEKPVRGVGMALKTGVKSGKPKSTRKTDVVDDEQKSELEDDEVKTDETDEEVKSDDTEEQPAESGDSETEVESEAEQETEAQLKYGAQVLKATYTAMKELVANVEGTLAPLENESVKQGAGEMLDILKDQMTAIEGLYSSQYADMPALNDEAEAKSEEPDEEAMKSFLSSGIMNRSRWGGHASRLKGMLTAKNLTSRQRQELQITLKGMQRIEQESRSYVKSSVEAKLDQVTELYKSLQKKVQDMMPHQRSV